MVKVGAMTTLRTFKSSGFLALLVGTTFGLWFVSPENVWPTNTGWLSWGDMAVAQNMWQYFRRTPNLQFPVTAVDSFGEGWGTIFQSTAGNVLVGLPLKSISDFLPNQFQYLGIWVVVNFALQGWFAERILRIFSLTRWERIGGAISVITAPVLVFRVGMTHLDLTAHWLILASLNLYFARATKSRRRAWISLIALALCVNIYLAVIVLGVGAADQIREGLEGKLRAFSSLTRNLTVLALSFLAVANLLGYYRFIGAAQGEGFFRLNALAFFNPGYESEQSFSLLLDRIPSLKTRQFFAEEGEGFAYLGMTGVIGVAAMVFTSRTLIKNTNKYRAFPIVGLAIGLYLVALSNKIALVRREFEIPVPQVLLDARQVFRVANRFSWLTYYILLIFGWIIIVRLSRRFRIGRILLAALLIFSLLDQWNGILSVRSRIASPEANRNEMNTAEWARIGAANTRMYLLPTFDLQHDPPPAGAEVWLTDDRWRALIDFGADHNLITNFAYVGRPVYDKAETSTASIRHLVARNQVPARSILFVASKAEWLRAQQVMTNDSFAGVVDGMNVIVTS